MKNIARILKSLLAGGILAFTITLGSQATMTDIQPGDIVALDLDGNIFRVDPITGDRAIITTLNPPISSFVHDIDYLSNGKLIAVGSVGIVEIDLNTGGIIPISTQTRGTGPFFESLNGIEQDTNGDLLVTDGRFPPNWAIFRVNLATGNRVIVSNSTTGAGPQFVYPGLPAIAPDGSYIVPDMNQGYITSVNRITGDRTVLAIAPDNNPSAVLRTPTGDYFVSFAGQNWIAKFNGMNFSVVSASPISSFGIVGSGPDFGNNVGSDDIWDIEFDSNGNLIAAMKDSEPTGIRGAIFRVNPVTGDRFIISGSVGNSAARGTGPAFQGVVGIAVVTSDSQPPELGTYPNATVSAGGNTTVLSSAGPTDNFSVLSTTAMADGMLQSPFTGVLTVNPATGVVTVTDAKPAGTYTVTVKAIDGAGLSATSSFTLTVTNPVSCAPLGFSFNSVPVGSGSNSTLYPFALAVGDLNGDSWQDLAVVNQGSDNLTILLGNGSGGFSPAAGSPFTAGSFPVSVAAGDYNGDGKQDLAVANLSSNDVTILLGNGSGGFIPAAGSPISVGSGPGSVVVGDFNGDGRKDLAVASQFTADVRILLGNGSGGFSLAVGSPILAGSGPISLALGDFNGDGKEDVAAANISSSNVTILLGNGSGSLSQATDSPISVGSGPIFIAAGDFNSDGKQDLATANEFSANISILLGDGSGGFSQAPGSPVSIAGEDRFIPLTIGDFDGDGKQDLAVGNPNNGHVTILLGNGSGGFSPSISSPTYVGTGPMFLAVGDFNSDGKQDIAIANAEITVMLNTCVNNSPPTISGAAITRQQGSPAAAATIATVSDVQDSAGALTVTATSIPTGISVTNISNSNGTITANVAASCSAALGNHTVGLLVTDSGGLTATANLIVNVSPNTIPSVTITSPASGAIYPVGTTVNFSGGFTDTAGNTHTALWAFDSIGQVGVVNEATAEVTTAYTFTAAGVYLVTLAVTDNCNETGTANTVDGLTAMVVVYDPNGGFVTGGGWINSPAGAYVPNPSLTGKASFGFVSKYQPGATVPTGNTEFQFKAGNLNFSSASYEWLVVAGAKAQYKGSGTINGGGDYRFLLTVIDGQQPGGGGQDKFRLRIWNNNGGGLVYDNQMNAPDNADPTTVLGGGSIVIHK